MGISNALAAASINFTAARLDHQARRLDRRAMRSAKKLDKQMRKEEKQRQDEQLKTINDVDRALMPDEVADYIVKHYPISEQVRMMMIAKESHSLVKLVLAYISDREDKIVLPKMLVDSGKEFCNSIAAKFDASKPYPENDYMDLDLVSIGSTKLADDPKYLISMDNILARRSPEFMEKVIKRKLKDGAVTPQQLDPNAPAPITTGVEINHTVTDPVTGEVVNQNGDRNLHLFTMQSGSVVIPIFPTTGDIQTLTTKDIKDMSNPKGNLTDEEYSDVEVVMKQYLEPLGKYWYEKESADNNIITAHVLGPDNRLFNVYIDCGKEIFGFSIYSIKATDAEVETPIKPEFWVPVCGDTDAIVRRVLANSGTGIVPLTFDEIRYINELTGYANIVRNIVDIGSATFGKESPERLSYKLLMSKLYTIHSYILNNLHPVKRVFMRIERYINENDFDVVIDNKINGINTDELELNGLKAMVSNDKLTISYDNKLYTLTWQGMPLANAGDPNNGQRPTIQ